MINNNADFLQVMHRIDYLVDKGDNVSTEELRELDRLCDEVREYEDRRYPLFD